MDKRYQIFVSSTFTDLQEERRAVIEALLEMNHMPSGMELFPAANDDQWTLIQSVINDCDYYIVIIGGRYGSIAPDGISYTEKEYRYALEKGKPILAFIHGDLDSIPLGKSEKEDKKREQLKGFIQLVQQKMVKSFRNKEELKAAVIISVQKLVRQYSAIGWIRADQIPSEDINLELLRVRRENDDLKKRIAENIQKPENSQEFAQGENTITLHYQFKATWRASTLITQTYNSTCIQTWNNIFSFISPYLNGEISGLNLESKFSFFLEDENILVLKQDIQFPKDTIFSEFSILNPDFETIKTQFIALGLIQKSPKEHSVKDNSIYWCLTPYGEKKMMELRAKKNPEKILTELGIQKDEIFVLIQIQNIVGEEIPIIKNDDILDFGVLFQNNHVTRLSLKNKIKNSDFFKINFSILKNLEYFDISENDLPFFPDFIKHLTQLTHLFLSNNQISSIPNSITQLNNIQFLCIDRNLLNSIPIGIGELKTLQSLDLSHNKLMELPSTLNLLENLNILDISDNEFILFPDSILGLKKLTDLNLSSNDIDIIPEKIGELTSLEDFDVSENNLITIPKVIEKLVNLKRLSIYSLNLNTLPETIITLKNLNEIMIFSNEKSKIWDFSTQIQSVLQKLLENGINLSNSSD